jgi:hypothetical protein
MSNMLQDLLKEQLLLLQQSNTSTNNFTDLIQKQSQLSYDTNINILKSNDIYIDNSINLLSKCVIDLNESNSNQLQVR